MQAMKFVTQALIVEFLKDFVYGLQEHIKSYQPQRTEKPGDTKLQKHITQKVLGVQTRMRRRSREETLL